MHLKSIKIRGFKSFPGPLEIDLEQGVAVVVGPNGSGKSNIADAVVWAAGSLTPSELRAEKPDDVLFAGGRDRKAAEHCEVELVFDNEDGSWPELDFSEVSIARRLVRGGEGQYLVNKTPVRRTDLVELLADVGLGSAMHSIVGQGKVEQVLASKPEDRRAFVEEAAGLGKFKRRRHRAELKLARVALQVERARDVEDEVRKRLRPLALQATAAERAEKLVVEIACLNARVAELDVADAGHRRSEVEVRRDAAALSRRGAQSRLEGLLTDRTRAEDELSDAAGRREAAVAALYRLQGGSERLELRSESAVTLRDRLGRELAALGRPRQPARQIAGGSSNAKHSTRLLPPDALRPSETVSPSRHGSRASGFGRSSVFSRSKRAFPRPRGPLPNGESVCCSARSRWSRDPSARSPRPCVPVLPRFSQLIPEPRSSCSSRSAPRALAASRSWQERGRKSSSRSSRRLQGRAARRLRTVRHSRRVRLRPRPPRAVVRGRDRRSGIAGARSEAPRGRSGGGGARAAYGGAQSARPTRLPLGRNSPRRPSETFPSRSLERSIDRDLLARIHECAASLATVLGAARAAAARFDAPLRARVEAGAVRSGELGDELRRLGAAEVGLRQELEEATERVTMAEVDLARLDAETQEARRRLEAAGAEPAEGDDRDELAARAERLENRRTALGQVNPLAREEYDIEKERLTDLETQRQDLERSLDELERLRADLAETVERRFAETFASVARNFEEVAATLFPGGEGRLRLVEPDDEESEHGVEVELRPAGKRNTRLSLLSGGEKALGAISFLFALFLARPCAFYLLDEVEAALDDTNIARFVELLRRYSDRAQFVVVTHQKRTMEAADVLYGVTMGPDGVSQVVSRRLPQREQAAAASAA